MKKSQNIRTFEFIEKAKNKHGSTYDYSKIEYNGAHTKVCIICPEHGEFDQSPTNHLSGNGCPDCAAKYFRGKYRLTVTTSELRELN